MAPPSTGALKDLISTPSQVGELAAAIPSLSITGQRRLQGGNDLHCNVEILKFGAVSGDQVGIAGQRVAQTVEEARHSLEIPG